GITADIEQSSAAPFEFVANVGGIAIEIAEDGDDGFEFANFSAADQFFYPKPLRVRFDHEGFTNFYARAIADAHEFDHFRRIQADRLFAQDMLPGLGSLD